MNWISVEDRLPNDGLYVDVYYYIGDDLVNQRAIDIRYSSEFGFDLYFTNESWGFKQDPTVTHWMPVPPPPDKE